MYKRKCKKELGACCLQIRVPHMMLFLAEVYLEFDGSIQQISF